MPRFLVYLLCCLLLAPVASAHAEQFFVKDARVELIDNVYRLYADFDFPFSPSVHSALNNGVILTLVMDIEVNQPRDYAWNKEIAILEQRYEIQYHAFTNQYLLHNKNSGAHLIFSSLQSALYSLGRIRDLPVIDAQLLESNVDYIVSVRARLDYDSLPVPLQLKAYLSTDWHLGSEWYSWLLRLDKDS